MTAAEDRGVHLYFDHPLDHLDVHKRTLITYSRKGHPVQQTFRAAHVFGTDGGGSKVRQALKGVLGDSMEDRGVPLGASYKELLIPAKADGSYALDHKTLHIWP